MDTSTSNTAIKYAMVGVNPGQKHPEIYSCSRCNFGTNARKAEEFTWKWVERLAEHTEIIEEAIKLATSEQRFASETKSIDASLDKWRKRAKNYEEDLEDENLRGDTRASIRQPLNTANAMIEQLETEQAQLMLGMIDKERERAAYQEILNWCRKVREAKQAQRTLHETTQTGQDQEEEIKELDYRQKRDFFRLLGLVVIAEKPIIPPGKTTRGEPVYTIKISLPEIQELIPQETSFVRNIS